MTLAAATFACFHHLAAALSLAPVYAAECACLLQEDDKFRLLLSRTLNVDGSEGAIYFDKVGQAVAASLCQPQVKAIFRQRGPAEGMAFADKR